MTEKNILDDKALEGVTGGLDNFGIFVRGFMLKNCVGCARYGEGRDCPYHSDLSEIYAFYQSGSSTCLERRPK